MMMPFGAAPSLQSTLAVSRGQHSNKILLCRIASQCTLPLVGAHKKSYCKLLRAVIAGTADNVRERLDLLADVMNLFRNQALQLVRPRGSSKLWNRGLPVQPAKTAGFRRSFYW